LVEKGAIVETVDSRGETPVADVTRLMSAQKDLHLRSLLE
jgi:hypothetical protein